MELPCGGQLGIDVGLATSLEDLGPYGRILRIAVTLHDYFRQGIALYSMLTTGQRLWLWITGRRFV